MIGPMVIAGVLSDKGGVKKLEQLGVKDSKEMSRQRREELAPKIAEIALDAYLIVIPPNELLHNLNQIELRATAQIIERMFKRLSVPRASPDLTLDIHIDVPTNPKGAFGYCGALKDLILRLDVPDQSIRLIGENEADKKYKIVGAASILAKVQRDKIIKKLREEYGDFGWGYPSEEKTQRFLQEWYEEYGQFPDFVRKRWKTVRRVLDLQRELEIW